MAGVVPVETVAAVLDHALAQPARLGDGRLVCVDGPAGSGKSTLARAVAEAGQSRVPSVHVIHTDDLLDGWRGLPGLGRRLFDDVVAPLAAGRPAQYRRYDWVAGAFAEEHVVAPMDLLVLDGVGTGHPSWLRTGPPWSGSAPTTTSGWPAGWSGTARRCGPSGSSSCSTRRRTSPSTRSASTQT